MQDQGLYHKFHVLRTDGRHEPGEKHADCEHFVLDLTHDNHALPAIAAYAESCKTDYPQLAADLNKKVTAMVATASAFITVPQTTLPNGLVVPSFQVGQFLCSRGPMGIPQSTAQGDPWVQINYAEARAACSLAGVNLITELQALAIAHDISGQAINWTGAAVGEGGIFQGLHKGSVNRAQPGGFVSDDPDERSWHELSNGERIYHFAGNAYSWVFDDVQGGEDGLVAKAFSTESPSISTAPHARLANGMGWRPNAGADWSGRALVRGGCWGGEADAGVFCLYLDWPDYRHGRVGFRFTK